MAKRSGSRSSRGERRAERERAERARKHGLPEPLKPALRARAATPDPNSDVEAADRSSDAPAVLPKSPAIPTLVKVLGGALLILLAVYLLSRQRDQARTPTEPAPEPAKPTASAMAEPALQPETSATNAPPSVSAASPTAGDSATVVVPTRPSVSLPSLRTPSEPRVARPSVVAPRPPVVAPAASPASPAVPRDEAP